MTIRVMYGALFLLTCLFSGCDGMNGCAGGGPPFPDKDKVHSAIQVRITESGLVTVGDTITPIIKDALPPELTSCLPGASGSASFIEWRYCNMETCSNGEIGCDINISVGDVDLVAVEPNSVRASVTLDQLSLRFDVGADPIIDCNIAIDGPDVPVNMDVIFTTPEPQRNLGIVVSDASYELTDITIRLESNDGALGGLCEVLDGAFNIPVLRDLVLGLVGTAIDNVLIVAFQGVINEFICLKCEGEEDPLCTSQGGACVLGSCIREDLTCITRPLGVEGESNLGDLVSSVTPGLDAPMSYFVNPGSYATIQEEGLSLGVIAGTTASLNRCVPPALSPGSEEPPRATALNGNRTPLGDEYDIGLAISQTLIDQAMWSLYNSGVMCLGITSATVQQLNSGTLGILLPTLSKITRGPAPIAITLSPQIPPSAIIGENRLAPPDANGDRELEEPLLTLDWPDLWLDFHAFMEGRWTRIFSLKAHVVLPLGVTFSPEGGLIPLLGDLNAALTEIEVINDHILLDDTTRISTLLPAVTGPLIGGALSSLSDPIALPEILGFSLAPQEGSVRGISEADEDFIAIFADLVQVTPPEVGMSGMSMNGMGMEGMGSGRPLPESSWRPNLPRGLQVSLSDHVKSAQAVAAQRLSESGDNSYAPQTSVRSVVVDPVDTFITLRSVQAPPIETWIEGQRAQLPSITLNLSGQSSSERPLEYSWQVDQKGWRPFTTATELTLDDPAFMLPGEHVIEVRARRVGDHYSLDPDPASISVTLYEVPSEETFQEVEPKGLVGRVDPATLGEASSSGCACDVSTSSRSTNSPFILGLFALFLSLRPKRWRTPFHRSTRSLSLLICVLVPFSGCDEKTKKPRKDPNVNCDQCGPNQLCVEQACVTLACTEDASLCDQLECETGDGECSEEGICQCSDTPLCPGGCGENEYCCYQSNQCELPPPPCEGSAAMLNCEPGFEPGAIERGRVNPNSCSLEGEVCECIESQPLEITSIGRFSDLAVDTTRNRTWVSGYVTDFGDLVVGSLAADGLIKWTWVDGVPNDGAVVAGPSGDRGGVEEAGEDVGQYTSLVIDDAGRVHVAYFDVSQRRLKYALGSPDDAAEVRWYVMTLDDGEDMQTSQVRSENTGAGWFTDITLDSLQRPIIIYRAQTEVMNPEGEAEVQTSVRVITASEAAPTSSSLWGAPRLLHTVLPPPELVSVGYPEGTGLYNSLTRTPRGLAAAWYDRSGGDLWVSETGNDTNMWGEPELIAGWSHPERRGDLGANVNLASDAQGNLHLCFQDGATDTLRYLSPNLERDEEVDDGVRLGIDGREHALHVVGEDCRISFDDRGRVLISYQDSTGHDLVVSRRDDAGSWLRVIVRGPTLDDRQSASGFYARSISLGSEMVLSHYLFDHQAEPPREYLEVINIPSP